MCACGGFVEFLGKFCEFLNFAAKLAKIFVDFWTNFGEFFCYACEIF